MKYLIMHGSYGSPEENWFRWLEKELVSLPYVPATEPPLFAEKIGAETHVVPSGGHCGGIFKQFPLLLEITKN